MFDKVDRNSNGRVNRMELRLALDFLCKQFDIDVKRVNTVIMNIINYHDNIIKNNIINIITPMMVIILNVHDQW